MTDPKTIKRIITDDDRFKLVGVIVKGNETTIYFCPRIPVLRSFDLEERVRNLFHEVPEITSIISTHGGVVMMTCSERNNDVKIPPKSIHVQCFINEALASSDLNSTFR